jgi:hypothetical protein
MSHHTHPCPSMVPFSPVNAGQQKAKLSPNHTAAHRKIPECVSCSHPCHLEFPNLSDKASFDHMFLLVQKARVHNRLNSSCQSTSPWISLLAVIYNTFSSMLLGYVLICIMSTGKFATYRCHFQILYPPLLGPSSIAPLAYCNIITFRD